jgi:hypothetical protein
MWIKSLMSSITALYARPRVRVMVLALVYLAILVALILMYGEGDFSTPPYVYQGF